MGDCIALRKWRVARCRTGASPAQFFPHIIVHREVEIGEDHGASRQFADNLQQTRKRRRGTGDPGGHNGRCRRIAAPRPGCRIEQQVAPRTGIDRAAFFQLGEPFLLDDCKAVKAFLPVPRQIAEQCQNAVRQQFVRRDFFHQKPVHRLAEIARQLDQGRRRRCIPAHLRTHDIGQDEQALDRVDGGRNIRQVQRIEQRSQRVVEIEIADNRHARQKHPGLALLPQQTNERLCHSPCCTRTWQEQRQPCQSEIVLRVSRQESCNQGIGKTAMGGNRVYLRRAAISHAARHPRSVLWNRACPLRTMSL